MDKATLEILPSNGLGDAVGQFVEKDDRHAVEAFVDESLKAYLKKMKEYDELDEDNISELISAHKSYLEEAFEKGQAKIPRVLPLPLSIIDGLLTFPATKTPRETRRMGLGL